jgi:tetratricopeptide (TPR) repeat protein
VGEAYLGLGQLDESRLYFQQALTGLGWPMPTKRSLLIIKLLGQVARQTLHRLWSAKFLGHAQEADRLLEVAVIYRQLAEIFYFSDETVSIVYAALQTLNLAERANSAPELAQAYASMCIVAGFGSLHTLAERYSQRAWQTAHRTVDFHSRGIALLYTAVYYLGVGQWLRVQERVEEAIELFERQGDRHNWGISTVILAFNTYHQGKFGQALQLWDQLENVSRRSGDALQEAWGLEGKAENLLRIGQLDQVIDLADRAVILLAEKSDRITEIPALGVLALAHLRQGHPQQARQTANTAVQLIAQSSPSTPATYEGYAGITEVFLELWEASLVDRQSAEDRASLAKSARQACKTMRNFARVFPMGHPRAWLYQGRYDWLSGKTSKAHKAWQKSLTFAQKSEMPYEEGLALYNIGRYLPAESKQRQDYLTRASEIFTRLEAKYDLVRTRACQS